MDYCATDFVAKYAEYAAAESLLNDYPDIDTDHVHGTFREQIQILIANRGINEYRRLSAELRRSFPLYVESKNGVLPADLHWSWTGRAAYMMHSLISDPFDLRHLNSLVHHDDLFWDVVSKISRPYEDSAAILEQLEHGLGLQIVGVTTTDMRLQRRDNDRPLYDPEYSIRKKLERFEKQRVLSLVPNIIVTDPHGKGGKETWDEFERRTGVSVAHAVKIGDTHTDMLHAKTFGVPMRIFVNRRKCDTHSKHATHFVEDFTQLPALIEEWNRSC